MLDGLLDALQTVFVWPNPLWVVAGVLFGLLIGVIPGMAGSIALALLIPLTLTMDTNAALIFLVAAYSPVGFGGQITSILVNTPGAPENAATTFDGYPLARQGRAGYAIGAATTASVIGGLIGTIILLALIPAAKGLIMQFSFPEFFMMALVGLAVIAVLLDGAALKGLIAAGAGLLLAFVGLDPITGNPRLAFGHQYLWDGFTTVSVLLGLFAGAEALSLFGKNRVLANDAEDVGKRKSTERDRRVTFFDGFLETFRYKWLIVRTSVIGGLVGILPGIGGAVSGFIGYSHAKSTSKSPELFGKGAIDGVIGAESANDAKEGGSLLPTVAFGIPGSVGMAVLLGALLVHGVPTGPTLMSTHVHVVYIIIVAMVICKFVAPPFVWLIAKQAGRITRVKPGILTPLIAVASAVGVFSERLDIRDVAVAVVFGYIGYAMKRYGYSRVALVIALVLGELIERSYFQTLRSYGGASAFFTRPFSIALLLIAAAIVAFSIVKFIRAHRVRKRTGEVVASMESDGDELAMTGRFQSGRYFFSLLLLVVGLAAVFGVRSLQPDAQVLPTAIGAAVTVVAVIVIIIETRQMVLLRSRPAARTPGAAAPAPGAGQPAGPAAELRDGAHAEPDRGTVLIADEAGNEAEAPEADDERAVVRRQIVFGLWAVAFTLLAYLLGFGIAIPAALGLFVLLIARAGIVKSLLVAGIGTGVLYLIFDLLIGVPLIIP